MTTLHIAEATALTAGSTFVAAAFTSEQIVTLSGGVVLIVGAISAAAVAIINALGRNKAEAAAAAAAMRKEIAEIATKATVIEGHVNSAATRDASIIASQEIQLGMLRDTVSRMEKAAVLLAQSAASVAVPIIVDKK